MSEKKPCPKCGEPNEVERTYCWVCYTPFDGIPQTGTPSPTSKGVALPSKKMTVGATLGKLVMYGLAAVGALVLLVLGTCSMLFLLTLGAGRH